MSWEFWSSEKSTSGDHISARGLLPLFLLESSPEVERNAGHVDKGGREEAARLSRGQAATRAVALPRMRTATGFPGRWPGARPLCPGNRVGDRTQGAEDRVTVLGMITLKSPLGIDTGADRHRSERAGRARPRQVRQIKGILVARVPTAEHQVDHK